MKTSAVLVLSAVLCVATNNASAMAPPRERMLRGSAAAGDEEFTPIITGGMSTHASVGEQCAYDEKMDASLYPCEGDAVCVRTSPLYGECVTKEAAAAWQHKTDRDHDNDDEEEDDDDDDDDGDEGEDVESKDKHDERASTAAALSSASKRGDGSAALHNARVGDEDEDEGGEDEDEDEEDATVSKPAGDSV